MSLDSRKEKSMIHIPTLPDNMSLREPDEFAVSVLLVDDQAIIGEAVRRMLTQEAGVTFHYCGDANEAVEMAERIQPTVILQDLVMPGVDGLVLVSQYRSNPKLRDLPIIVLSSKEDPKIKSQAFAIGANDYLVKLPDVVELIARIRYHSRAYLALKQRDLANQALRLSRQQLVESNLALQRMTKLDGLTGLSNRRHFDEQLDLEWKRARREQLELSLLIIDVDYFKSYNDSFGHVMGDEALRSVAQVLSQSCSRSGDMVARYGGEEFAIILPNTSHEGACSLADGARLAVQALAIAHVLPAPGATLTISVGVATMVPEQDTTKPIALIQRADTGLYQAKEKGRNRIGAA